MHKDTVVKPFGDRVLLKTVKLEDLPRESGLVMPEASKTKEVILEVVAIGEDVETAKIGDKVIIGGDIRPVAIKLGDDTHIIVDECDILAFID